MSKPIVNNQPIVVLLIGSASRNSSNLNLAYYIKALLKQWMDVIIVESLQHLPHFDPELSIEHTPEPITLLRKQIKDADGVIICTPEYVFSLPAVLKNALEWFVSTTIFSEKPTCLITASANGAKGHEQLQLIMHTLSAQFNQSTSLLISGIKGKVDSQAQITHVPTANGVLACLEAFYNLIQENKKLNADI